MRAEIHLPWHALTGFLLVLARVSGAMAFVPLPGMRQGMEATRVVFALAFAFLLLPRWPAPEEPLGAGRLAGWLILEAALGIFIGLAVSVGAEALTTAAQIVGLPAGYAYASVVDPQTQADSGVLLVLAQLAAGMIFFALGLEREVVRIFAWSLDVLPPGAVLEPGRPVEAVLRLGRAIFETGLRLALPALALLLLVDVALALLARLHAQMQLLTLAFPLKMLAALAVLAAVMGVVPRILRQEGLAPLRLAREALP